MLMVMPVMIMMVRGDDEDGDYDDGEYYGGDGGDRDDD